jgi:hypothetical protein
MAKDRKKLLHIHSSIPDKQPTAASLEVGEIAVNNAENQEFLSLKNSNDKVVRFSSDEQIVTIMEKKEVMPYDGYVRGETGPSGTKDGYGSYGITENDLLSNTSNIVIKLNQVAAGNTVKHDEVNGAKDRYNKCVNPTSDSGLTDGAGFYIDMSRYAMQGANPTFSGITNTCYTELNGRTEILGGDGTTGSCRSLLNIDVLSATTNVSSAWTTGGTADTTISSAKTDIETALTEITSANTTIGTDILHVSGTTTETHDGAVTINNNSAKTETTTGINEVNNKSNYNVNTSGDTNLTSTGDTNIHSDANICETADANATFYGAVKTNVGLNCNDNASATTTNVYGGTLNTSASTANTTIGTANTTVTLANTTATTANYSGQTLSIAENTTDITSCGHLYINTNDFKLQQCDGSEGSAEFKFCDGFTVDSDAITLEQCGTNGSIIIKERDTTISGTNLTVNESDDVTVNVGDDFTVNTTGDTTFTVTGKTVINSTDDVCISSQDDASFYGKNNTKIGVSCDGSVTTDATVQSTGTTNLYGPTVNISGTTENNTFTTINTTGTTINQTGTNYNVTANTESHTTTAFSVNSTDACIVGSTEASLGGGVTNIGANCQGTPNSTTTNVYGNVVLESGTTNNNTFTTINNTAATVNNNTTTFNITGGTNITGDTNINGDLSVDGEICLTNGLCKTLTWTYGDVKTNGGSAVNSSTNFKEDKAFVIPRCVGDMNRSTFGYSYGDVHSLHENIGGTYDPGEACANQTTDTVTIPTSIGHLHEWSQNCFTIDNNLCVTGNITATGSVFSTSDERKKENINFIDANDKLKARNIPLKSFNFKEDNTKRKVYGVIAQEVEAAGLDELVHTDEEGMKSVDYTSFLILRIAYLERMIGHMHTMIVQLEEKLDKKLDKK